MLSKQAIEEFQGIYFQTYGKELSFDEATVQAHQLIRFCKFALGYPINYPVRDHEAQKENVSNGAGQTEDSKDE
jgi:hypothetical protein